jgi:archaellum component FlaF (FlaF/FlaG flagellin family)
MNRNISVISGVVAVIILGIILGVTNNGSNEDTIHATGFFYDAETKEKIMDINIVDLYYNDYVFDLTFTTAESKGELIFRAEGDNGIPNYYETTTDDYHLEVYMKGDGIGGYIIFLNDALDYLLPLEFGFVISLDSEVSPESFMDIDPRTYNGLAYSVLRKLMILTS